MSHAEQIKLFDPIRELTLDEVQAVSGGGDASGDDFGGEDGGGPVPNCPGGPRLLTGGSWLIVESRNRCCRVWSYPPTFAKRGFSIDARVRPGHHERAPTQRGVSLIVMPANKSNLKMPSEQTKSAESIRELTLDEVQAVSGGDGGGPVPVCCGCDGCGCGCSGC